MSSSKLPLHHLAGWALAVLVAGCGGGDQTSTDSAPTDEAQAAEVAPLPDAELVEAESGAETPTEGLEARRRNPTTPSATGSTTCGLPDFQAAALARINAYRAAGANCRSAGRFASAQPLVWESRLAQAAAAHSQDMAARNYFSHTSPTGSTMVSRINATGYAWSTIGENIAAGYPTVNAVVDGWMASDGHCANLMNPKFKDMALACVASSTSTYRSYWTLDLGRQR
jgi:uncharacterized protein YkwD